MATERMSRREFLQAIATMDGLEDKYQVWAAEELAKMEAYNMKKREKPSKTAIENAPLMDEIVEKYLSDTPITAAEVMEKMGLANVHKASALLRALVKEERAVAVDVKVPKKGTCKGYTLA